MERRQLEPMARALTALGPDGVAIAVQDRVGLVRALRATTPEDARDRQPLAGSGATTLLVADVRLDERGSLVRALGADGSDAELVLRAHEQWGEAFYARLLGAFALALWDARRARLLCVRDPMGERPLHFASDERCFAFASSARALLALGHVPRELDDTKVVDALARLPADPESTYLRHVKRLPPGCALEATAEGVRTWRYFDPMQAGRIRMKSDGDYVDAARTLLEDAVRARLRRRVPVAALTSGGLDSPTVAWEAARQLSAAGEQLVTYTALPHDGTGPSLPGRFADERPYVEALRAAQPLEARYVTTPRGRLFEGLDAHHEQALAPVLAPFNFVWADAIAREARERGFGVMLNGQLGNLTLSWHGRPARAPSRVARLVDWLRRRAGPAEKAWAHDTPLRLEAARRYRLDERVRDSELLKPERPSPDGCSERVRAWRRGGANTGLAALEVLGLEPRDPLGDRRIFEFCLGLPREQFARDGKTRLLIRRMMQGRLPAMVVDNERRGWQSADWLLHMSDARPRLPALLERIESSALARELIDLPRMRGLLESWPSPEAAGSTAALRSHHGVLPRALAVGLFVEWFERSAAT